MALIDVSAHQSRRIPRALARGVRVHSGTDSPGETTLDPWLDEPFPDYTEPVVAFSAS
jgi:hypothetical protein